MRVFYLALTLIVVTFISCDRIKKQVHMLTWKQLDTSIAGCSMHYPGNWIVKADSSIKNVKRIDFLMPSVAIPGIADSISMSNFVLEITAFKPQDDSLTFEAFKTASLDYTSQVFNRDLQIINNVATTVNTIPAWKMEMYGNTARGKVPIQMYYINTGGRYYTITALSSFQEHSILGDEISEALNTLQIKQ